MCSNISIEKKKKKEKAFNCQLFLRKSSIINPLIGSVICFIIFSRFCKGALTDERQLKYKITLSQINYLLSGFNFFLSSHFSCDLGTLGKQT